MASSSGRGLAAQVLQEFALDPAELVDDLDHVDGDADGAGLVGHGAGDGLADPPGGVGGELVALGVVELFDGADEAEVAFLDEVEEGHAAAGVALGEGDDQTQVRLQQVVLGPLAVPRDPHQVAVHVGAELLLALVRRAQPLAGVEPGLDPLGQLDLLLRVEQRNLADLLEIGPDGVGRRGQLGVAAGLLERLGLLVVPLEVVGLLRVGLGGRGHLGRLLDHDVFDLFGQCFGVEFDVDDLDPVRLGVAVLGLWGGRTVGRLGRCRLGRLRRGRLLRRRGLLRRLCRCASGRICFVGGRDVARGLLRRGGLLRRLCGVLASRHLLASPASGTAFTGGVAFLAGAFAVVAFAAAVAERAAATGRWPRLAVPSTCSTPASVNVRTSFLAWLADSAASSTALARAADDSSPPVFAASASSVSVSVRTSGSD